MIVQKVIPVLRIFDYKKAIEFYVDWLEFKIDWEHTFEENTPNIHAGFKRRNDITFERTSWRQYARSKNLY